MMMTLGNLGNDIRQVALGEDLVSSLEIIIPVFLIAIFAAAFLSSRSKIPYTIMLVGIGIAISILSNSGVQLIRPQDFRIDPKLIIDFVIPPLIFEAMMKVDYHTTHCLSQ
jgi:CPA1 family monovalent cation:H+ antiporter